MIINIFFDPQYQITNFCLVSTAHDLYSYPRCQKLHEEGDYCRPDGPMITNGSRTYPDESEIMLDEVFVLFCPCAPGLICDRDERVCRNPQDMKDFNYLDENKSYSNKRDD